MPEKILIVDDDIDSLKLIGLMLQRHGYEVIAANAGNQAIAKAISEKPNLIILDVMMPDMDGYEVTRRLRAEASTQDTPIIMFTAKTLIDDKVIGFEAGADDYLTKPTHPAELASRVKALLARNANKVSAMGGAKGSRTIGVFGVKGGVGVTTLAVNIAASLAQNSDNTLLADFNLGAGGIGAFLGQTQSAGMANLLSKAASEINERSVESQLIAHPATRLRLLLTSPRPKEALLAHTPESAVEILRALKQLGNPVVLDLGSRFTPAISRVLRELDLILLVLEPSKVALNLAREILLTLESDGVLRDNVNLTVMNRSQSSLQTPWQEIEQLLGQDIKAIISAAPDLAFQANEAASPIVNFRPNSITASQLVKLADELKARVNR